MQQKAFFGGRTEFLSPVLLWPISARGADIILLYKFLFLKGLFCPRLNPPHICGPEQHHLFCFLTLRFYRRPSPKGCFWKHFWIVWLFVSFLGRVFEEREDRGCLMSHRLSCFFCPFGKFRRLVLRTSGIFREIIFLRWNTPYHGATTLRRYSSISRSNSNPFFFWPFPPNGRSTPALKLHLFLRFPKSFRHGVMQLRTQRILWAALSVFLLYTIFTFLGLKKRRFLQTSWSL